MKRYRSEKAGRMILATYDRLLAAWGLPVEERDVSTRYGSTHVLSAGSPDAPPLLLFHGVGDDSALMWLFNAGALAGRLRLYAVDTLGGPGKSVPGEGFDRRFDDVLWIDDLYAGLGLDRADILGVSHGGYLAQLYAARRPHRVGRLAAISAAVAAGGAEASPMKTMLRIFLPEALLPTERNIRKLLCKLSGEHTAVFTENPLILEHYRWLIRGFSPASMGYHRVEALSEAQIDAIRPRALFLAGEADPFMRLGGKEALLREGMNAVFYPGAGHGLNHELAGEVNAALLAFFAEEGRALP